MRWFAFLIFFLVSCSETASNTVVGSGSNFGSLDTLPGADEFYQALSKAIDDSLTEANGESSGSDIESDQAWTCQGGGSVVLLVTTTEHYLYGTAKMSDCAVTVILNGDTYQETISGEARYSSESNGTSVSADATSALTISGDLGFSADCEASISNVTTPAFNTATSIKCTFQDDEGTELKSEVTDGITNSDLLIPRAST
jgi:hypothetical protein